VSGCQRLVELGRRQFLKGSGTAAAGAVAAAVAPAGRGQATPALARVDYPSNRLANFRDLEVDQPFDSKRCFQATGLA
jgi:arsenite oxidase small subunit